MTGRNEEQILDELKGLIFETPDGMFVTRAQYLSGNVREKLRAAERAVNVGGQTEFAGNVEALKGVLPEDVGLDDLSEDVSTGIKVTLGQRWVPISMYQEFANYLFTDTSDKTGRRTGTRSESRELVVQQDPETGRYQLWVKDTGWQPA